MQESLPMSTMQVPEVKPRASLAPKRHRHLSRRKTDLDFAELEHQCCIFCAGDKEHKHEHKPLLIPVHTLKLRLFLYVQRAMEGVDMRNDESIYICQAHLQKVA